MELISAKSASALEIQISNSMCGSAKSQGTGLGLPNTRGRLKYLYRDEAQFEFKTHEDQFATATLTIPAFESSHSAAERERSTFQESRNARAYRG